MFRITGVAYGSARFPSHPEHVGAWGVVGGEECTATRSTFNSVGEAMTWCRRVLTSALTPRRIEWQGPLLDPRSDTEWTHARVSVESPEGAQTWVTEGSKWFVENPDGSLGEMARDDEVYFPSTDA